MEPSSSIHTELAEALGCRANCHFCVHACEKHEGEHGEKFCGTTCSANTFGEETCLEDAGIDLEAEKPCWYPAFWKMPDHGFNNLVGEDSDQTRMMEAFDRKISDIIDRILLKRWEKSLSCQEKPRWGGYAGILAFFIFVSLLSLAAWNGSGTGMFVCFMFVAIFLHELGHLLAARIVGIPIRVFSVGIGPLIRSFSSKGGRFPTQVEIRAIPLLGSVEQYEVPKSVWNYLKELERCEKEGESPTAPLELDRSEKAEPVSKHISKMRSFIFSAGGIFVNFITAVASIWLFESASPLAPLVVPPEAGLIRPGSIAEAVGVQEGDRFVSVAGKPVKNFWDLLHPLAHVDDNGAVVPALTHIDFVVRRAGKDVSLVWQEPEIPSSKESIKSFGILPPMTWTIEASIPDALGLEPGDIILSFRAGEREVKCDEPGAHSLLDDAFAIGPVEMRILRQDREMSIKVKPWQENPDSPASPPFILELKEEIGTRKGLLYSVIKTLKIGYKTIVGIPEDFASCIIKRPSKEEQGWIFNAVKKDPWTPVLLFGFFNTLMLFLNILPIPPLDGFRLLCIAIESVIQRELSGIGLLLLELLGGLVLALWILLNLFILFRDIIFAALGW